MWASEEDFQSHLDANPEDSLCRLAFSDWLEEHERQPEALGWRALGTLGVYPKHSGRHWVYGDTANHRWPSQHTITFDWLYRIYESTNVFFHKSRRAAEYAAVAIYKEESPQPD